MQTLVIVEFVGLEAIPNILTRPQEIRASYQAEVERFRSTLRSGSEKNHVHFVPVNTAQPLHEVLSGYLAFRLKTSVK